MSPKGLLLPLALLSLLALASAAADTATPKCPAFNETSWNATYWDFSAPINLPVSYKVNPTTYTTTVEGANFTLDEAKKNFSDYWTSVKSNMKVMDISGSPTVAYGETWSIILETPINGALGVTNVTSGDKQDDWMTSVYVGVSNVSQQVWDAAMKWKSEGDDTEMLQLHQMVTCNISLPSITFIDTDYIKEAGSDFNDSDAIAHLNKILGTTLGSNLTKATHYPLPEGVTMPSGYEMPPIPPPTVYYVRRIAWPIKAGDKAAGVLSQTTLFSSADDATSGKNATGSSYTIEVDSSKWDDKKALGDYVRDIETFMTGLY